MIDAPTVQFKFKFEFALYINNSLNFNNILKKSFFPLTSMVTFSKKCKKNLAFFFKTFAALKCMYRI